MTFYKEQIMGIGRPLLLLGLVSRKCDLKSIDRKEYLRLVAALVTQCVQMESLADE